MKKATVALIGRTNVGKSTLFNRLIGRRKSITKDIDGVTRDRLYDKVTWQNKEFMLIDTGGLDISNTETINQAVKEQVELALVECDLVLFVVDGKAGLQKKDFEIADIIRRTNKKVALVVNKIDNKDKINDIYEFYELGFYDIYAISAEHSMGIGDLLDHVIEHLEEFDINYEEDDKTKIALIGKPNVGKSSLTNLLLSDNRMIVTDIAGTTRDSIDSYWSYNDKDYVLIDTAGLRKRKKVTDDLEYYAVKRTLDAIDRSHISIFMLDATVGVTEQDTKIVGYAHNNKKAIIIVVNKWDLIEKETNTLRDMQIEIQNKLGFISYAPIVFISVKNNQNIKKLLDTIEIVDNNYSLRIKTGILNDILREAILISPPPFDKGKRLKIYYMSQVYTRPPKFLLHVNNKELFHFSYLRYIENTIRKNYDFKGVPFIFDIKEKGDVD